MMIHRLCLLVLMLCALPGYAQPVVAITFPSDNDSVTGTVTVEGASAGAQTVEVSIDGGGWQPVNGLQSWNHIIEDGALTDGEHTIRARARGINQADFDRVVFTYASSGSGEDRFEHPSSVDGEPLAGVLYVPAAHDPDGAPSALVCYLHGGGGRGRIPQGWDAQLEARNMVFIAPDGRFWGLADPDLIACMDNPNAQGDCNWCTSAAYVDNPFEPLVGPGEQDILDSVRWAMENHNIDPDRVYLTGFSMGGRGAYQIGLRNPDRFAAIAPLAPASDMYEVFERRPNPPACKEGMVSDGAGGGRPGDSAITDTLYTITSGRFLIENAYNLPVFHAHGTLDVIAYNVLGTPDQYLHGAHMLDDNTWDQPHGGDPLLDFGHTPTLDELHTHHPDGYVWDFLFTEVGHSNDIAWAQPIFEFFDTHTRDHSPETVVYKTYTDQHRDAYWVSLDTDEPWSTRPAAVRATRNPDLNQVSLELARTQRVLVDLAGAGITTDQPITLELSRLIEPVYDPGLDTAGETLDPSVVLLGGFVACGSVEVTVNGAPVKPVSIGANELTLGPIAISGPTTLTVICQPAQFCAADLNFDGVADFFDVSFFVLAYLGGDSAADFDGDGVFTFFDVSAFLTAFGGC